MDDLLLGWRNIWRNPGRSILTILAVAFAALLLVFMLSFQLGSYEDMINASVQLNTGHLQIQAPGFNEKQEMRKTVRDPEAVLHALKAVPGLTGVSPRAQGFALAASANRTRGALVIGVRPDTEPDVSTLPGQIRKGRYLEKADAGKAVMGSLLAERLRVGINDEVTLLGQGKDGSVAATVVQVVGIYKAGIDEFDRNTLQITLRDFDEAFSMNGDAHRIVISADRLSIAEQARTRLESLPALSDLKVLGWAELVPGLRQSIQMDLFSGLIMYLILVIVVAFSIFNTFLMAIFERTHEFGVLMAIGTRPGRLVWLMLMESMSMTAVGLVLGMILGAGLTFYFSAHGISLAGAQELLTQYGISDRLYPRLSWISLLSGPAIILVITFFTALYPSLRIPKLRPAEALRAA